MLKALLRSTLEKGGQYLPLAALHVITGKPSIFPYYHLVSDETPWYFDEAYPVKTKKAFEKDLDVFLRFWKPIGLPELIAAIDKTGKIPPGRFHVSFDDGYREVYDVAYPVLKRKGIPATTFVCSALLDNTAWHWENKRQIIICALEKASNHQKKNLADVLHLPSVRLMPEIQTMSFKDIMQLNEIGRLLEIDFELFLKKEMPYLTSVQINMMIEDGFTFGAHSIDHPHFQELSLSSQAFQITHSVNDITKKFNLTANVFAFPYGEFGISANLYECISRAFPVDLFFGTRGIINDENPGIIQRLWMETNDPSGVTIKKELSKKIVRQLVKNDLVTRK